MWHFFWEDPGLPESSEAMTELAASLIAIFNRGSGPNGRGKFMRMTIRRSFQVILLAFTLSLISAYGQPPEPSAKPEASATIASKKPVFAGACKACPWGILAKVTADALSFYGYQTTICWVCWSSFGPREMADKTKPVTPQERWTIRNMWNLLRTPCWTSAPQRIESDRCLERYRTLCERS